MPVPTRPTAPPQPLRSSPDTFSRRAELAIQYQWTTLPEWIQAVAEYAEQQANAAASAAAAAGAAEGLNLEGKGGQFIRVRVDETGTEFVNAENARAGLGATLTGSAIFTASNAASARATLGATAVGSAVLTAADAAAARSAISAQGNLGFTPIQQGGGAGQGANKIYIGWDAAGGRLRAQVDASDIGRLALQSDIPAGYTDAQARSAQAGANVGSVGSLAMMAILVNGSNTEGQTRSGSQLGFSNAKGIGIGGGQSGTWRCMGRASTDGVGSQEGPTYRPGLWLRIA
ncbi:MAG: hypothetical protein LPK02_10240 [Rhodobacterales bacterium]|nr:hypothetical protein [Rhodobacterales bacterium]